MFFCVEASGAGLSYVTKFRCHYQMDLLGHTPERKTLHAIPSPTQTLPSQTFTLCCCAGRVLRISEWAILSEPNRHLPPTMTSPSVEPCAPERNWCCGFWFTMLHPSECSWVTVFYKHQNVDLTVQTKGKLEQFHLAFLWLTQASRWKSFPEATAKLSTKVSHMENIRHEGTREAVLRARDFCSSSHPWPWQSEPDPQNFSPARDCHRNIRLSSLPHPSRHLHLKPCSCFLDIVEELRKKHVSLHQTISSS